MLKNRKYLKSILLFSFISFCFFISCKEEVKTTYEDRLTGQLWILSDYQIEGNPVVSIYSYLDTCVKDNTYRFFQDGTFTLYEGTRKCVANDPVEQRGTWSFSDDRKQLFTTNYKGERSSVDILIIEKTLLKLRYTDTSSTKYLQFFKPK